MEKAEKLLVGKQQRSVPSTGKIFFGITYSPYNGNIFYYKINIYIFDEVND